MISWRYPVRSFIIRNVDIVCGPVIENSAFASADSIGSSLLSLPKKTTDLFTEILF